MKESTGITTDKVVFPKIRDYPKIVYLNGLIWRVRFKRDLPNNDYGMCDSKTREISIRMRQSPKNRLRTFCHEWGHAVEYSWGLEVPHEFIYALESGMFELIVSQLL